MALLPVSVIVPLPPVVMSPLTASAFAPVASTVMMPLVELMPMPFASVNAAPELMSMAPLVELTSALTLMLPLVVVSVTASAAPVSVPLIVSRSRAEYVTDPPAFRVLFWSMLPAPVTVTLFVTLIAPLNVTTSSLLPPATVSVPAVRALAVSTAAGVLLSSSTFNSSVPAVCRLTVSSMMLR